MTKKGLTYTERGHRYTLDGRPVMGVTTLLNKGLPKPAIPYWAAKTVAEYVANNVDNVQAMLDSGGAGPTIDFLKKTPWEKRDQAGVRGTDVHALAEKIAHGEEVDVPEHLLDPVQGYVRWLDEWMPEVIFTERPVGNRQWWYAGTPDIVCSIDGQTWLLDWKTSTGVYGESALQVASYGHAEFYVDHDGTEQPMPKIDRYGVVHIAPNETLIYEITDPESAWKDFLHVAWTAKATDRIKEYLGQPVEAPTQRQGSAA